MSLAQADRPIPDVLRFFAEFGIEVGLLVPTATGLTKSIMDAHASLRDFLKDKRIHDYATQPQGQEARILIKASFITTTSIKESQASLYRPQTKAGDPRIWIYGLPNYAAAGNVVALLADRNELFVVNASDLKLLDSARNPNAPLYQLLQRLAAEENPVALELLSKLRDISTLGYIRTLRPGSTGVGYTLETLLGIEANSRRTPDYKGIEIKAGRVADSGRSLARGNLFSMVPDWSKSPYTALRLLKTYGQDDEDGGKKLYCEINHQPNPTFGFYLRVEDSVGELTSRKGEPRMSPKNMDEKVFSWSLEKLRAALILKHRDTFWVKAKTRGRNENEEFLYYEVTHTSSPRLGNFSLLIESGLIEVDFLLKLKTGRNGRERAKDHGYLFKIEEENRELLFTSARRYSLGCR